MSEKEGVLYLQSSGRWAVCRPGRDPVEIMSGDLFRVEVDGELLVTRMEHLDGEGYYSIDELPMRDGIRAAICTGFFQEQREAERAVRRAAVRAALRGACSLFASARRRARK